MTRRISRKRTTIKPLANSRSGVIAGIRTFRGCHTVQDELPS
jgi:hypothetical protein